VKSVVKKNPAIDVATLRRTADRVWAARLMAASEPWLTLGRNYAASLRLLQNPAKEYFLITDQGERAGFLILDLKGPLGGYIQTIGVAPEKRGAGVGTAALHWAERYIFSSHRNILMCVSSFNRRAARLYRKLGYQTVGRLRDYVVAGHDEILLRKTMGPLSILEDSAPAGLQPVRRRALQKSTDARRGMSLNK
jgi:ribosomal protein S18 acetylase RimI-like enzyme